MPGIDPLLRQAVAGDADALGALLLRHGPVVAGRLEIGRSLRGLVEAEDVMQVTYLEAFLHIRRFDPDRGASFEGWLHQIARHNLLDAVRGLGRDKQPPPQRRVQPDFGESAVALVDLLGVTTTTPSREAGRAECAELVEQALESLPADYARVVRLYDLQGKAIAEVASELGRSPGAVHMLRARAHDALRDRLGSASGFLSHPA
ncbi:MAG: sigma-70 family RNA polymerase sigma factor [Phycisphaerales bacterium]|nr:sigma-70 family RNA polymerase sigma factor [Phycisphaerales bacterium]